MMMNYGLIYVVGGVVSGLVVAFYLGSDRPETSFEERWNLIYGSFFCGAFWPLVVFLLLVAFVVLKPLGLAVELGQRYAKRGTP